MGSNAFEVAFLIYNSNKIPFKEAIEKGVFDLPKELKLYVLLSVQVRAMQRGIFKTN